ncbi:MAG TPA: NAD(P)/FAD-dependent oxidoreductase, partial [Vicinamibacteria bacterium]
MTPAATIVVIGGGVNGLVTAALLAKAGRKVVLLERRETLGGAAVTEEFHPGFRVSSVAHLAGPFRAALIEELKLADRVGFAEPEPRVFAPLRDGRSVRLWGNPERSAGDIHRLSPRDAERYPAFHRSLEAVSGLLARALTLTPPDIKHPFSEPLALAGLGLGLRGLGRAEAQHLLRWLPMPVADFAAEWFESEILRAAVCARGLFGVFAGPWSGGTTANLLLQAAHGGGNGAGAAVHVRGGLGALTQALAEAARAFGAELRTGCEVQAIAAREGRVAGVVLKGGEEIPARAVASAVDPHRTFLGLLDAALIEPEDLRRVRHFRMEGMASKVHLALDGLPAFAAVGSEDAAALLAGRIHVGETVDGLERAFDDAKYGGISREPWLDVTIPSLADPALAPAGKHVMSVHVQYTPYQLREGGWAARRDEVGDLVLRTLEAYAPGITRRVVHRQVLTPLDLEQTYGLTGGHPFHGEHALDQLFLTRPQLGWSRYRGPVPGL